MKDLFKIELENEDVFMNPTYVEFCLAVVSRSRNGSETKEIEYRAVEIKANGMDIRVPCQLFIDGKFVDAENGRSIPIVNPADESVICEVFIFRNTRVFRSFSFVLRAGAVRVAERRRQSCPRGQEGFRTGRMEQNKRQRTRTDAFQVRVTGESNSEDV